MIFIGILTSVLGRLKTANEAQFIVMFGTSRARGGVFIFLLGGEGWGLEGFLLLGWKGGFCLAGSGVWGSRGSRDRGSNLRLGLQC